MQAFLKGHAFFIGTAMSFLLLSILCRFMTGVLLKKLIKEAENMSATDNKLLKQCKLKFQNCYELNNGVVNVGVFVEKFMQNVRLGRCSLRLIGQLSGQLLLLSVFAEGIGSCVGIVHGETLGDVLPYYLLAFLFLYLYFSISGLIDVPGKQEALKTSIMDFLENRMKGRIVSVKKDSEYLDEVEKMALAGRPEQPRRETEQLIRETEQLRRETEQPLIEAVRQDRNEIEENETMRGEKAFSQQEENTAAFSKVQDESAQDEKAQQKELEALLGEFLA